MRIGEWVGGVGGRGVGGEVGGGYQSSSCQPAGSKQVYEPASVVYDIKNRLSNFLFLRYVGVLV